MINIIKYNDKSKKKYNKKHKELNYGLAFVEGLKKGINDNIRGLKGVDKK